MTTFPIPPFASIPDMDQAINMLGHSGPTGLQAATVNIITKFYSNVVDKCVNCAEALYADACYSASTASDEVKELCNQLASFCVLNMWHEIGATARGSQIAAEMRRQLGDPSVSATEADRPAVLAAISLDPTTPIIVPVTPS